MLELTGNAFFPYRNAAPDLSDCEITRDAKRPWLLTITEPLPVAAPATAEPLCCYLRSVIFYECPLRPLPPGQGFAEYGRCETRLMLDDVVRFEGERFALHGGRVEWDGARWVMTHRARLEETN